MVPRPSRAQATRQSSVMEPARLKRSLELPLVLAVLCGLAFKIGRQGTRRSRAGAEHPLVLQASQPPWARQRREEPFNTTMHLSGRGSHPDLDIVLRNFQRRCWCGEA
jgi:hypothetical protein